MKIELIYDKDCPNVEATREHLRQACELAGVNPKWREWDRADDSAPVYVKAHGSPTVLIDGHDVAGQDEPTGDCCRIYKHEGQMHGVPPVAMIAGTLRGAQSSGGLIGSLSMIPAAAVSLMPALSCPVCWPAYASLLGSLGLGFMIDSAYLMPITVLALLVAVGMMATKASQRHGYGPLILGVVAASVIVVGKFWLELDLVLYGGVTLLVAASVWNAWPRKKGPTNCSACDGALMKEASP